MSERSEYFTDEQGVTTYKKQSPPESWYDEPSPFVPHERTAEEEEE